MPAKKAHATISVTVDGVPMKVRAGLTILQSLTMTGLHIPSLCGDIRLERSNGNCGMCVVTVSTAAAGQADAPRDVRACITPVEDGMVIDTMTDALQSYRKVRLEQLLADHNADCEAPCQRTCPAHIDIQRYLNHVVVGNFEDAVRVIKETNPFPSACGHVCPHPCEAQCRRNLVDEPVGINHVKRFVADWDLAREHPWVPRLAPTTGKRIAVVGAGPSGLTAAYYLALAGHKVLVFEKQPLPGGMMRYGIPEYRLPKAQLDAEIDVMRAMGIDIACDKSLGVHLHLENLRRDYDAVYLAFGSWQATPLAIDGDNLPGVSLGINWLAEATKGASDVAGKDVIVIGGGNTAIDCVRTALRQGATSVKLVYRRTKDDMPAEAFEVEAALAEGIEMVFLTAPGRITADRTGRKLLHCMAMELGEPDRSGRRRPIPVEGSDFTIEADVIIGAIGQATNTQFMYNDLPLVIGKWGDIDIDAHTMRTSEKGIFAGGDCVTGPATVIQAIAAGKRAASAIDEFVRSGHVTPSREAYNCSRGTLEDLPRHEFEALPRLARLDMPELPVETRVANFDMVELGLSAEEAQAEARRCLRCGCSVRHKCQLRTEAGAHDVVFRQPIHQRPRMDVLASHPFIIRDSNKCIHCGKCISACSEIEGVGVLAYRFERGAVTVSTTDGRPLELTDCVSCGQCVTACPCGALTFKRERGKVFRAINDPSKVVVGFVAPSPRSVIAEKYGLAPDQASGFIAGLMKAVGFDKAFDFSFAADLTIVEEATEFLNRVASGANAKSGRNGVMPQFTSCCPGWVNLVERRYPELIPHLSSCRSPQAMMGATVKTNYAKLFNISLDDLYVVSIVPCLAKKYEAARPEFAPDGVRDVDAVLTTTEFLEMVDMQHVDVSTIIPTSFDEPYSRVSGAGVIFGASGGVAEAALRMAVEKMTGEVRAEHLEFKDVRGMTGFRHAEVKAGGKRVRVAVISGLGNAEPLIKRVIAGEDTGYDFVEIMACPGGCVSGAGNPAPTQADELARRQAFLFNIDQESTYRKSHENPDILRLYSAFYGEPNSELAHQLLHTTYRPFETETVVGPEPELVG